MAIRQSEARKCFGDNMDIQLSEQAVSALALHLDSRGRTIAMKVLETVEEENRLRRIQGLPPRKRIFADDIAMVIENIDGEGGVSGT